MAVTEFIGSFAWVIQTGIMIMIVVELVRVFTSFKKSNTDTSNDVSNFIDNFKDKVEKRRKNKEAEAEFEAEKLKENEQKLEEMVRFMAREGAGSKKLLESIRARLRMIIQIINENKLMDNIKQLKDAILKPMKKEAGELKNHLRNLYKSSLGNTNRMINEIKKSFQKLIIDAKNINQNYNNELNELPKKIQELRDKGVLSKEDTEIVNGYSDRLTKLQSRGFENICKNIENECGVEINKIDDNLKKLETFSRRITTYAKSTENKIETDINKLIKSVEKIEKEKDLAKRAPFLNEFQSTTVELERDVNTEITTIDGEIDQIRNIASLEAELRLKIDEIQKEFKALENLDK